jgi:hypothetical protein
MASGSISEISFPWIWNRGSRKAHYVAYGGAPVLAPGSDGAAQGHERRALLGQKVDEVHRLIFAEIGT